MTWLKKAAYLLVAASFVAALGSLLWPQNSGAYFSDTNPATIIVRVEVPATPSRPTLKKSPPTRQTPEASTSPDSNDSIAEPTKNPALVKLTPAKPTNSSPSAEEPEPQPDLEPTPAASDDQLNPSGSPTEGK